MISLNPVPNPLKKSGLFMCQQTIEVVLKIKETTIKR